MIVNTAGWDTDCNSGNVGCILGIKDGLSTIDNGPDWRSPVNDIMYCPTANGGQTMTDAVTESYKIIDMAKKMNGEESVMPKNNSRYHFEMPGSVQGWKVDTKNNLTAEVTLPSKIISGVTLYYFLRACDMKGIEVDFEPGFNKALG